MPVKEIGRNPGPDDGWVGGVTEEWAGRRPSGSCAPLPLDRSTGALLDEHQDADVGQAYRCRADPEDRIHSGGGPGGAIGLETFLEVVPGPVGVAFVRMHGDGGNEH